MGLGPSVLYDPSSALFLQVMSGWVIKARNGSSVRAEVHLPFLDAFLSGAR